MQAQNIKVMNMTDTELKAIIAKGEVNTFLHFQAKREFNARYNGGKRKIEPKEDLFSYYENGGQ